MVDNQHRVIKGYRDLNETELDAINSIKDKEESVAVLWRAIRNQLNGDINPRWMNVAKTHFEEGFSAFVRAVARPDSPFDED